MANAEYYGPHRPSERRILQNDIHTYPYIHIHSLRCNIETEADLIATMRARVC